MPYRLAQQEQLAQELLKKEMKNAEEKAKEFEKSKLEIVKELREEWGKNKYKWTEKDIIDRQRKLAEYAYDVVWKFV